MEPGMQRQVARARKRRTESGTTPQAEMSDHQDLS
jgi:hypothetical protein